ncbi:MAG: hypothetical protein H7A46_24935 [Verrucomicrobiales bacterium]|nr:hypothetical protein [Verrucomicrobiales bacterium]
MRTGLFRLLLALGAGLGLQGCATHTPPPAPTTPAGEAGREVYVRRCANCHRFYDPGDYAPGEWTGWMDRMAGKARLLPAERDSLDRYLNSFREQPAGAKSPP